MKAISKLELGFLLLFLSQTVGGGVLSLTGLPTSRNMDPRTIVGAARLFRMTWISIVTAFYFSSNPINKCTKIPSSNIRWNRLLAENGSQNDDTCRRSLQQLLQPKPTCNVDQMSGTDLGKFSISLKDQST